MQRVVLGVSCIAMLALASACEIYDYPDTGVTANTGTLERDETIEEGIIVNEYTFTEGGRRFG